MIQVEELESIHYLRKTLLVRIQELNVIDIRFFVVTNYDINVRFIPVLYLVPPAG